MDLFSAGRRQPVQFHVSRQMVVDIDTMWSDNRTAKVINSLRKKSLAYDSMRVRNLAYLPNNCVR